MNLRPRPFKLVEQFAPGQVLGHYRILEKIGEGGMGEVYRARDDHLGRDVAIKVLPAGTLADDHARKRFHKEADVLSQLNHPNVATIYDFDTQEGVDFLVMEYIPGETLSDKLCQGPVSEKEVVRLGLQLVEGLAAAHGQGVIHRDLKPGNLRLTSDGRLKILDFGLAKLVRCLTPMASTESLDTVVFAGTLPYMAPEQLRGVAGDQRTDIYSAGVVLYELATGRLPFPEKLSTALSDDILHRPPPPPGRLQPEISQRLEDVILKCLEKQPENRYHAATELEVDLRRLQRAAEPEQVVAEAATPLSPPSLLAQHWQGVLLATSGLLLTLAVVAALWVASGKLTRKLPLAPPSVAVLPFVDMSPQKDQEYFSDGLAEELLNQLVKIPSLRVAARTSSFQFKGKTDDLRTIAAKLNVGTILEGSVRRAGGRVRISVQLVNAADGFHLWSQIYDREVKDIFAVQEEIASAVVASLQPRLVGQAPQPPRATNPEAYNAYLKGRYLFRESGGRKKDDLEKTISYYQQALRLDPGYAAAWVALAMARCNQADYGSLPVAVGYAQAREATQRALTLDADSAEGYAAMGHIKWGHDWDWEGAEAAYRRGRALQPGNAVILAGSAELATTLGRYDEAIAFWRQALELDPLNISIRYYQANTAYRSSRQEEAIAAIKQILEMKPDFQFAHSQLGWMYVGQSRPQEALTEAEREKDPALRLTGLALAYHGLGRRKESDAALAQLITRGQAGMAFQIAEVYAFRGQKDQAFEWLERAYDQRDGGLARIKGDPLFKNLESDPRYAGFLKKMRLPA